MSKKVRKVHSDDPVDELDEFFKGKLKVSAAKTDESYEGDSEEYEEEGEKKQSHSKAKIPFVPPRRARTRLLVGEADGSFARAVLSKHEEGHPDLKDVVVVTELESEQGLERDYPDTFPQNREFLQDRDVQTHYGVNGTKLHEHKELAGKRFSRIHFNFPHDKKPFQGQTLPKIVKGFFASAKHLQKTGDEVHMALPKPEGEIAWKNPFYKGYIYDLYKGAAKNGYQLFKKRPFNAERFPGYQHVKTGQDESAEITKSSREYIFKKTDLTPEQILAEDTRLGRAPTVKSFKKYDAEKPGRLCIAEITTDDDSSGYDTDSLESPKEAAVRLSR